MKKSDRKVKTSREQSIDGAEAPGGNRKLERDALRKDRLHVLDRILGFKKFLSCSFEPEITHVDVLVCFADLRGFTSFCKELQNSHQDRKIQNFLRSYVKIFNRGLVAWVTQYTDPDSNDFDQDLADLAAYVCPSTYKNLGDGMMLVWEVPREISSKNQATLSRSVVSIVEAIESEFNSTFNQLAPEEEDALSDKVTKLKMGFGLAKGHAWRLDFSTHLDYAGSVMNLAARLQDFARPGGIVSQFELASFLFSAREKGFQGKVTTLTNIKGYESPVKIWASSDVEIED